MAKPRQTRWICPDCGNGRLAPTRPRREDVRRYCLPCSEATGKLVERHSPAMLKQRERKAEAAKAKRVKQKARERELETAKWTRDGVDLRDVLAKAMRLPEAKGLRTPRMVVQRKLEGTYSGHAKIGIGGNKIFLRLHPDARAKTAVGLLLHELAHCLTDQRHGWRKAGDADPEFGALVDDLLHQWNQRYSSVVEVRVDSWNAYRGAAGRRSQRRNKSKHEDRWAER